ncbi:Rv3654c family TadE-like protein [Streptomyces sp. NPDC006197]|uniref:Rv3654c family TadE-like protein n=1 Tax=Streptomyces sp. NPDC006197 TaxID=3156685 RepID=UPI0033AFC146
MAGDGGGGGPGPPGHGSHPEGRRGGPRGGHDGRRIPVTATEHRGTPVRARPGHGDTSRGEARRPAGRRSDRRPGLLGRPDRRLGLLGRPGRRAGLVGDRGAATVWAAFAACALCVVFGVVLALGQAVAARHRAGGAADLAALAAADRALWGEAEACATASRVAVAQGAELARCAVRDGVADVTARVVRGPYRPEVRSRAGPPGPPAGVP